nr:calcium/sodium antiporter [Methanosarcina sp. KYL-1]
MILLLAGLILLVKGSDLFVMSSSAIAKRLGVSEFIIGLTLVSVGTSVPELASSLFASFQGASGIVIGNVIGSNIANIGLIVSTAAVLSKVKTEELMLRRDGYIMFFAAVVFYLFSLNFEISRLEALVFLLLYVSYILFLLDKVRRHKEDIYFKDFLNYFFKFEYIFDLKARIETGIMGRIEDKRRMEEINKIKEGEKTGDQERIGAQERIGDREKAGDQEKMAECKSPEPEEGNREEINREKTENSGKRNNEIENECRPGGSLPVEGLKLLASGIAIIIGARYFIDESIFFARLLEIPETLIGMSLVAVGTSLPELMVTVSAARSGYANIAIGNAIGSNITNIFLILGCSALVYPLKVTGLSVYFIAPFMLFISFILLFFIWTGWEIKRFEGLILLLLYSGFMVLLFHLS